jgi:hypothetical protein
MNIYVVVDGEKATKKIYQKWIPLVNNELRNIDYPDQFAQNNFYVFAGRRGQPGIWNMAEKAVEDANNIKSIERLVICVDSEDRSYEEILSEAKRRVDRIECRVPIKYVIQYFCLETWLLGNINLFRKKPKDQELQEYYTKFNIRDDDPKNLPSHKQRSMNRATFAYYYLRAGIRDMYGNDKYYSKHNAGMAQEVTFFNRVRDRCIKKQHIQSFNDFLNAFV